MEDEDTDEMRSAAAITLTNKITKTKILSTTSSSVISSSSSNRVICQESSAERSGTIECESENEVENIPDDTETRPIVTDETGVRVSGGFVSQKSSPEAMTRSEGASPEVAKFCLQVNAAEGHRRHETITRIQLNSGEMMEADMRGTSSKYSGTRMFMSANRSPQSSSSQEEYEPEVKCIPRQHLLTAGGTSQVAARSMESLRTSRNFLSADERYSEDSRSLESLTSSSETHVASTSTSKTHYRSFLTSSSGKRDVRRVLSVESRSSENLLQRDESLNAEVRRGLFANTGLERKIPQHLSLPPPAGVFSLTSPGGSDRKITILSPHSPVQAIDFQHYTIQTLKTRRKKALPRLVLPRSESEVFLEWVENNLDDVSCLQYAVSGWRTIV